MCCIKLSKPFYLGSSAAQLTLKIVTFPIHENVVDQNDAEDAGPEMDVTEHKYESNILVQEKRVQAKSRFIILYFENKAIRENLRRRR